MSIKKLSEYSSIQINNGDLVPVIHDRGDGLENRNFDLGTKLNQMDQALLTHEEDDQNPHNVTKDQVGLGNVTNESKETMFNNPALTGNPTAVTPENGNDTTSIATTEFVNNEIDVNRPYGSGVPLVNGVGSAGASSSVSREDHEHPIDLTRAPLESPAFTGLPSFNALEGSAPFAVPNAKGLVVNLNSDLLDNEEGSFYRNASNMNAGILPIERLPAITGDIESSEGSATTAIKNKSVSNQKLRDSAALSVIGNASGTGASPDDIVAEADGLVLRRNGNTIGFGQIGSDGLSPDSVTNDKIVEMDASKLTGSIEIDRIPESLIDNTKTSLVPGNSFKGNIGTDPAHVSDLSVSEVKTGLGLNNVTNESKETMFTNPVFTGTPIIPISEKTSVAFATTTNISLSGPAMIDSNLVEDNVRVLVKDQTLPEENGVYISSSTGAWSRASDCIGSYTDQIGVMFERLVGAVVAVKGGSLNKGKVYKTSWTGGIIGTDPCSWYELSYNESVSKLNDFRQWRAGGEFGEKDPTFDEGIPYRLRTGGNKNLKPSENPSDWELLSGSSTLVNNSIFKDAYKVNKDIFDQTNRYVVAVDDNDPSWVLLAPGITDYRIASVDPDPTAVDYWHIFNITTKEIIQISLPNEPFTYKIIGFDVSNQSLTILNASNSDTLNRYVFFDYITGLNKPNINGLSGRAVNVKLIFETKNYNTRQYSFGETINSNYARLSYIVNSSEFTQIISLIDNTNNGTVLSRVWKRIGMGINSFGAQFFAVQESENTINIYKTDEVHVNGIISLVKSITYTNSILEINYEIFNNRQFISILSSNNKISVYEITSGEDLLFSIDVSTQSNHIMKIISDNKIMISSSGNLSKIYEYGKDLVYSKDEPYNINKIQYSDVTDEYSPNTYSFTGNRNDKPDTSHIMGDGVELVTTSSGSPNNYWNSITKYNYKTNAVDIIKTFTTNVEPVYSVGKENGDVYYAIKNGVNVELYFIPNGGSETLVLSHTSADTILKSIVEFDDFVYISLMSTDFNTTTIISIVNNLFKKEITISNNVSGTIYQNSRLFKGINGDIVLCRWNSASDKSKIDRFSNRLINIYNDARVYGYKINYIEDSDDGIFYSYNVSSEDNIGLITKSTVSKIYSADNFNVSNITGFKIIDKDNISIFYNKSGYANNTSTMSYITKYPVVKSVSSLPMSKIINNVEWNIIDSNAQFNLLANKGALDGKNIILKPAKDTANGEYQYTISTIQLGIFKNCPNIILETNINIDASTYSLVVFDGCYNIKSNNMTQRQIIITRADDVGSLTGNVLKGMVNCNNISNIIINVLSRFGDITTYQGCSDIYNSSAILNNQTNSATMKNAVVVLQYKSFDDCKNLQNCTSVSNFFSGTNLNNFYGRGFSYCTNLKECSAEVFDNNVRANHYFYNDSNYIENSTYKYYSTISRGFVGNVLVNCNYLKDIRNISLSIVLSDISSYSVYNNCSNIDITALSMDDVLINPVGLYPIVIVFNNCKDIKNFIMMNPSDIRVSDFILFSECSNVNNIRMSGTQNTTDIAPSNSTIFFRCTNINNVLISLIRFQSLYYQCSNVSNTKVLNCKFDYILNESKHVNELYIDTCTTYNVSFIASHNISSIGITNLIFDPTNVTAKLFDSCNNISNLNVSLSSFIFPATGSSFINTCNNLSNIIIAFNSTGNLGTAAHSMFNLCNNINNANITVVHANFANNSEAYRIFNTCNDITNIKVDYSGANNLGTVYLFLSSNNISNINLLLTKIGRSGGTNVFNGFGSCINLSNIKFEFATLVATNFYAAGINIFNNCTNINNVRNSNNISVTSNLTFFNNSTIIIGTSLFSSTASGTVYGFVGCKRVNNTLIGSVKTAKYQTSYVDNSNAILIPAAGADTAAGGFNT